AYARVKMGMRDSGNGVFCRVGAAWWVRLENRCRGNPTEGSNPSLSACLPARVTQVVVTRAFAFLRLPQNFPFVASFVAFCGGRVL
ncbi:MAG TPA: hypothetical protein VKD72_05210, partial [Gemmataceae bacterium]|nr:hypothetical protein [Gemmataceae bacterium]